MLDRNNPHYRQVELLVRVLPLVAQEKLFALKGGTAINLFVRDLPRLSVDIDLTYLPIDERDTALLAINDGLARISTQITRVEKGDPKCGIGVVFELSALVGVKLFDEASSALTHHIKQVEDKLALLPKAVHKKTKSVDDDF